MNAISKKCQPQKQLLSHGTSLESTVQYHLFTMYFRILPFGFCGGSHLMVKDEVPDPVIRRFSGDDGSTTGQQCVS